MIHKYLCLEAMTLAGTVQCANSVLSSVQRILTNDHCIVVPHMSLGRFQYGSNQFGKKTDKEGFEIIEEGLPTDSRWSLFHNHAGNF